MNKVLQELAEHNLWATNVLIDFCVELEPEALEWKAPGTYGTIHTTLQHLVDAEAGYVRRLLQLERPTEWLEDSDADLPAIRARANELGALTIAFLANDWDSDAIGEGRGDDGLVFEIRADVFFIQLIHHGNEHRAHVCTILGAHDIEPPEVSAWGWSMDAGRSWVKA